MTKSFRELGKKAETLVEQGREAEKKVQNCQARVASATSRVAAARHQLATASETDENGKPIGDVETARAQLSMAESQLAASQRALSGARDDMERVRKAKGEHVLEIEHHNEVERSNLEKLRRLALAAFSADAAMLTEGIAERLNEAEDARIKLLRSMGIDATPNYASASDVLGEQASWSGGGFSAIDTIGQAQNYRGGGASVPGAVAVATAPDEPSAHMDARTEPTDDQAEERSIRFFEQIEHLYDDSSLELNSTSGSRRHGRLRTPNEILADIKKSIRENWMNNFNANEWRNVLPPKLYLERLEMYRRGIAIVVGDEVAKNLSTDDLERLSHIQNQAYLAGCHLDEQDLAELYRNTGHKQKGNFVTRTIERKMDETLREAAHKLLQKEQYSIETWRELSVMDRKAVLQSLLSDMNDLLGTSVSPEIEYFYEESGVRGGYVDARNKVRINEYFLSKESSYKITQTMIHEMRHAYQHHSIKQVGETLVSSETINAWEKNFDNYRSPSSGSAIEEYLSQAVEWDAKNFAKQHVDIIGVQPKYSGSWV